MARKQASKKVDRSTQSESGSTSDAENVGGGEDRLLDTDEEERVDEEVSSVSMRDFIAKQKEWHRVVAKVADVKAKSDQDAINACAFDNVGKMLSLVGVPLSYEPNTGQITRPPYVVDNVSGPMSAVYTMIYAEEWPGGRGAAVLPSTCTDLKMRQFFLDHWA